MPSTEVYILGQKYTIKGEAPEEHIRELSGYIDKKIKEVHKNFPNIASTHALIVTLFNISDELFRIKAEQDVISKHIEEKAKLLSVLIEG